MVRSKRRASTGVCPYCKRVHCICRRPAAPRT